MLAAALRLGKEQYSNSIPFGNLFLYVFFIFFSHFLIFGKVFVYKTHIVI